MNYHILPHSSTIIHRTVVGLEKEQREVQLRSRNGPLLEELLTSSPRVRCTQLALLEQSPGLDPPLRARNRALSGDPVYELFHQAKWGHGRRRGCGIDIHRRKATSIHRSRTLYSQSSCSSCSDSLYRCIRAYSKRKSKTQSRPKPLLPYYPTLPSLKRFCEDKHILPHHAYMLTWLAWHKRLH